VIHYFANQTAANSSSITLTRGPLSTPFNNIMPKRRQDANGTIGTKN